MLPAPSKVTFLLEAVIELPDEIFKVSVPESDAISVWAAIVICPAIVLSPDIFLIAPL